MKSFMSNWGRTPSSSTSKPDGQAMVIPLRQVFNSPDLRRVLPGLAISTFLSNILALAVPLAILQIMDRVVSNQSIETLMFLVLGIIVAIILEEILKSLSGLVTGWLGARFEHSASIAALERMLHVPMKRYQREEPGAYAERILSSVKVAEFYSGRALLVLFDLPFVVIFLALIYIVGGWLVIVPCALLLIFMLLIFQFGRWMRSNIQQRHVLDDRRFNFMAEVLSNIHSVKSMTMENLIQRRYERLQEANAEMGEKLNRGGALATSMATLFSQLMIVSVVFAGAIAVLEGQMTPGGLAACMMLSVRALQPLVRSLAVWLRYQSFDAAHERLGEVMQMPCDDNQGKEEIRPIRQGVELRDVSLCHDGGKALFNGVSLHVKAGQCIAILGDSGSGKTTLLSMLDGLVKPDSGEVIVDGRPIQEFASASLPKEIAFLPQSGSVVAGTILENMTMFDHSLNHDALRIARELGLDRVVAGMKLGYETPLGEGVSGTLPEGVRQTIAIVRALAKSPSLILFDEANISLDMEGDRLLRDYLEKQKGEVTIILVTPRPSWLSMADMVYVLRDGRLVADERGRGPNGGDIADGGGVAAVIERPPYTEVMESLVGHQLGKESDLARCLLPLLDALGWSGPPRELAEAMPHLVRGLDLSDLCSVLSNLEFQPRSYHGALVQLDTRLMPCLFLPDGEPALVIRGRTEDGRLRIFDSGDATEKEIQAPPASQGEIYLFKMPEKGEVLQAGQTSWFGNLFWKLRRHIVLVYILTVISTLLALAPPLFVMTVYDRVIPSRDVGLAGYILLGVLIAIILDQAVRLLKGRVMAYIGGRAEYVLGSSVFQRIIALPISSTEGASVSRQVGRIKSLESLREFFLGPMASLAFELPATLIMLIALALINPAVIGVVMLAVLAYALLGFSTRKINESAVSKSSQLAALRWELLTEALTNMRIIRSTGSEQVWLDRFRNMSGKSVLANFKIGQVQSRISSVSQAFGTITGLLSLALSAMLVFRGEVTGGAMIASMMIVWRVTGPIQNIFTAITSIVQFRTQMRQVENLMKLQGERDNGVRQTIRPGILGALNFSRVSFRYSNDADPVLLGVNFGVNPGELLVIAGPNRAGKTTLLKLVVRVYVPQAGSIRLDNIDIRQLTTADLRSRISYMPQNCEIFYGTVAQNLRLVYPEATDDEVNWAVEMAGLMEDVKALPQGFETRISNSKSEQLPHGFRQRLSLARTILKPASIVLMDEPGTGMDQAGEEALMRCIQWLRGRATVLMISHRPGHMRMADNVIYLEHGSVTAMGTFEQIKAKIMAGMK
ncbi:MAG: ATP-binding cassette domain-containing protein [Sulfuricella sp.]|nr:ATP-binding cassette domain-containing protein [Sulfuricella sp.]